MTARIVRFLFIPVLFLVASCDRGERSTETLQPARQSSASAARSTATLAAPSAALTIQSADGATAFQITPSGSSLKVTYTVENVSGTLEGTQHASGKRKYAQNGQLIAEVKPKEGGFKVRSPDGKQLYWKIKREADKVKISDNEENAHPFELKSKSDRIEVLGPDGATLGTVRADPASHRALAQDASGKTAFTLSSDRADRFLGVALMKGIPAPMRAIIIAELSAADR